MRTSTRGCGTAAGLEGLGVNQGDHVVCWLPNGPDMLPLLVCRELPRGCLRPANTAYRGGVLSHVLKNSDARVMIAHADLVPRLGERSEIGDVEAVASVAGNAESVHGLRLLPAEELHVAGEPSSPSRPIEPWDTQAILYTSGTTGPSKGVLSSYMQAYECSARHDGGSSSGEDRFMINMPMFHVGGASSCCTRCSSTAGRSPSSRLSAANASGPRSGPPAARSSSCSG